MRDPDDEGNRGGAPKEPAEETVMVYRKGEGEAPPAPEAASSATSTVTASLTVLTTPKY